MNQKSWIWILLLLFSKNIFGSDYTYCFWLAFNDKDPNIHLLSTPELFLSTEALNRRKSQNIKIDYDDIPVATKYIDSVQDKGFLIQYPVKWLNGIVVYTNDSSLIKTVSEFSFINEIKLIGMFNSGLKSKLDKFIHETRNDDPNFQNAFTQIALENGFYLHNRGYKGKGVLIAIIDAGFSNADIVYSLDSLWNNNRVKFIRDFSTIKGNLFEENYHGMSVLSIISGNVPNFFIGSAPEADVMLLRSEVVAYEQPIEEYNWIAAAEFADSAGADIINTSLGYSTYDFPFKSYTYNDMNGKTAPISKAATIANRKGMLIVNSAGNEGASFWNYITAPADADSILAVGATGSDGLRSYYSSIGPSSDNRIKPDIMAQGSNVVHQFDNGSLVTGNGTSFSAPVISGLAACLWQMYPDSSNQAIRKLIIKSASLYNSPNEEYGYGIPDFYKASVYQPDNNSSYPYIEIDADLSFNSININFFTDKEYICILHLYNLSGESVYYDYFLVNQYFDHKQISIPYLSSEIYILNVLMPGFNESCKLIKIY